MDQQNQQNQQNQPHLILFGEGYDDALHSWFCRCNQLRNCNPYIFSKSTKIKTEFINWYQEYTNSICLPENHSHINDLCIKMYNSYLYYN